jgi:hypothetical protein
MGRTILKHGSSEYKCVASMYDYGRMWITNQSSFGCIHLATPWFLEGAIRGSGMCVVKLVHGIYNNDKVGSETSDVLLAYWMKMENKFREWGSKKDYKLYCDAGLGLRSDDGSFATRTFKDLVGSSCEICQKQDSEILT